MIFFIAGFVFSAMGGWISRMCGGGKPKLPLGLDQWLYALPYGALTFYALLSTVQPFSPYPWYIWALSITAYLGAFLGKRTGHGGFMDLGTWTKPRGDERLEFIIKRWYGRISEYAYDFLGLAITGLSTSLFAAAIIFTQSPLAALALLCGGALKAAAYAIGWKQPWIQPTVFGEVFTGVFAYGSIAIAFWVI